MSDNDWGMGAAVVTDLRRRHQRSEDEKLKSPQKWECCSLQVFMLRPSKGPEVRPLTTRAFGPLQPAPSAPPIAVHDGGSEMNGTSFCTELTKTE
jgi:hypothetical protein